MTVMAILQEVDKCIRCNGCVIACKREWKMKQETIGVMKVAYDQRLAIKSQRRGDMGPFIRYSCWHCPNPPCAPRCPKKAITKKADGAVDVNFDLCDPAFCTDGGLKPAPCVVDCQRGGYPKVGLGSDMTFAIPGPKAYKCTLCSDRAGATNTSVAFQNPPTSQHYKSGYTSTLVFTGSDNTTVIDELRHAPMCVMTCPAKAMIWDTRDNVLKYLQANYSNVDGHPGSIGYVGNGSIFWASKKSLLAPPKADPFVEDHLSPLATSLFSNPVAKAAIVPTLLIGGLLALSARRAENEGEVSA
jgi:Fe-S-cluster-containing dehydrogenase component